MRLSASRIKINRNARMLTATKNVRFLQIQEQQEVKSQFLKYDYSNKNRMG